MNETANPTLWGIHAGASGDGHGLAHYGAFDSRYKGALPLKRVYVPEGVLGG